LSKNPPTNETDAVIANPLRRMKLHFSRIAEMDAYKYAQRTKAMDGLSKSREAEFIWPA